MVDLTACLEKIGLKNIQTFLQSGNVKFESGDTQDQVRQKIETALTNTFKYPAKVIVVTEKELTEIAHAYPFKEAKGSHRYVVFLSQDIGAELLDRVENKSTIEQFQSGKKVIYWQVEKGQTLKSPLAQILNKSKYKDLNTVRNLNTIEKILDK